MTDILTDYESRCRALSDALHKCRGEYASLRNRYAALADGKPPVENAIVVLPARPRSSRCGARP